MEHIEITTHSEEESRQLAKRIGLLLSPGDVLTLEGDLGAGKTTFTKGIAEGLGITRTVTSPTFTIIKEYSGKIPLYHMDAYRLEDSEEDIGFTEYFEGDGVSVIEWAQFIEDYLPQDRLDIEIHHLGENKRKVTVYLNSEYFKEKIKKMIN